MGVALLLAFAAASTFSVPSIASDSDNGAVQSACRDLAAHAEELGPIQLRRLSELPPGSVEHAVYRVVRGCPVAEVLVKGETYFVPSIVQREDGPVTGSRIARRNF